MNHNKRFFMAAFVLGLAAVAWVGAGFFGTSWLALAMTLVIAGVYVAGAWELKQFRTATATLAQALAKLDAAPHNLGDWLAGLHPALQNAVRSRVEGERVALPGPALTPYLVGLLVMLGMLGTFLGMVVTFKGAVFALEGSTDLQAIRSALAAPIKGLGLAFGTSVVGVATSAMLGLMSAISRRERLDVVRRLDASINTVLRPFSLVHQRQETFKALQQQAHALPEVVDKLQSMMDRMEQRGQLLDTQLLEQQANFHRDVGVAYTGLADTVGTSLKDSLTASAKIAGESLQPVVEAAMAEMAAESQRMHTRLSEVVQVQVLAQVEGLSAQFGATARTVSDTWTAALQNHTRTSDAQAQGLDRALASFTDTFAERSGALLATVSSNLTQSQADQALAEQQRLATWTQSFDTMAAGLQGEWQRVGAEAFAQHQAVCQTLEKTASDITAHSGQHTHQALEAMATFVAQAEELGRVRAETETRWLAQHDERMAQVVDVWRTALEKTASDITERSSEHAGQTLGAMEKLMAQSEDLGRVRTETEARWLAQQEDHMQKVASVWRTELGALRAEEDVRGQAAVDRLGALQAALALQLATLGTALEEPMTRLVKITAEVPQAAAEVIAQLRQEMTRLTERDNIALEERTGLVEKISTLLQTIDHAADEQRAAMTSLVESTSGMLTQASGQFTQMLDAQSGKAADVAAHVSSSAVELASLGESFQHSVQLFNASNEKLMDNLQRIESTVSQSMARSDEQLAYYVAQAREVIDLSITSQQGIVEDLRQLHQQRAAQAEAAL
ncbi:MAG: DUF802 domain-containing protein [Xylophilus sp.]|nr:DUF802 domain-containing protein [Xylophilus sp.]MBP6617358.1 DUF802 domain-containing protein [Burkholderiaceae bacterium]MBP8150937.1 DUF802 domain-containing protein [Xylophilus sp.]MBP8229566.1 DUF802 domain-containing protein [Xylophilus sp.]